MDEKTSFKDWSLRAVSVLGVVAVLIIGVWGIIQIALAIPGFFSGPNKKTPTAYTTEAREQLTTSVPASITSGKPFTLSWSHQGGSGNYGYTVSYSCATGLSMYAPTPSGKSKKVPCDTTFNFTSATENMELTPTLESTAQVNTTMTVTANKLSDGSAGASGSATATVLPATTAKAAVKPVVSYPSVKKTALSGLPNLTVHITGMVPANSGPAVQFTIANTGTNAVAAGWMFVASLPTDSGYNSGPQQALNPGDKISYTLGVSAPTYGQMPSPYNQKTPSFVAPPPPSNCAYAQSYTYNGVDNYPNVPVYNCQNNYAASVYYANSNYAYANQAYIAGSVSSGSGAFTVTVDPQNYVQESNETDNTASIPLWR